MLLPMRLRIHRWLMYLEAIDKPWVQSAHRVSKLFIGKEPLEEKFQEQFLLVVEFTAMARVEQSPHAMTCELCTGYMRLLNVVVQLEAFYEVCYYELRNIESSRPHSKKVQYTVDVAVKSKLGDGLFTSSVTELQVPWDPGGYFASAWGQAEFEEGGMSRTG